jgi:D-xylose transport system permease protein
MNAEPQPSSQAVLAEQKSLSTGEFLANYWKRVRGGDIGSLPIIVGLLLIALIFQSLNQNFLTPVNLSCCWARSTFRSVLSAPSAGSS